MQSNYNNYDWDSLISKMPIKKTLEDRKKRKELWNKIDINGNNFVSLAEFDKGIRDVLNLPDIFKLKKVILRAFKAAKNKVKSSSKYGDEFVGWLEFRIILIYLRQYFEYYVMFCRIDSSNDFKISINEFKKAIPTLEKWGIKINDPESEFNKIDTNNGGVIMFDEFCTYAIKKNLDLEDDDDFDDDDIKKMK